MNFSWVPKIAAALSALRGANKARQDAEIALAEMHAKPPADPTDPAKFDAVVDAQERAEGQI